MALAVFLIAILSLASYLYCWSDIKSGRPHILSLRQITLVMDREALNRMFGAPDAGYRYALPPETLAAFLRARQGYVWREMAADALCAVAAWRALMATAAPALAAWLLWAALLCQGVNLVFSLWLVRQWGWQIKEEMEDIGD